MIGEEQALRVASESVGAKVIDGEAVIINVSTGAYYSLDGPAAVAWEMLVAGDHARNVAAALTRRYEVKLSEALDDVLRLATELFDQGLLVPDGDGPPASPPPRAAADEERSPTGGEKRSPYDWPELITFTDIQDLLALDPPMPLMTDVAWREEGRT